MGSLSGSSYFFFQSGHILKKWNETLIALILKTKVTESILDLRSISLINLSYKIISKIMVNRLKLIIEAIVSPAQSAFIAGRLI